MVADKPDPQTVAKQRAERKARRQTRKQQGRVDREINNAMTILAGRKPKRPVQ